jgi:hypothetical protein
MGPVRIEESSKPPQLGNIGQIENHRQAEKSPFGRTSPRSSTGRWEKREAAIESSSGKASTTN